MPRGAEVRTGLRASASRTPGARGERGAATAEAMVVLPVLLAVALGLVWVVALAVTQVRVVDGAREAARAAARGESVAAATAAGRRVAPGGAAVLIRRGSSTVQATVSVEVGGPGGLFAVLPDVTVTSRATAAQEPT